MIEDKKEVLALLLPVVQATRAGKDVEDLIYEAEGEAGFYEEAVTIKWNDKRRLIVDVTADSGVAMIRDVLHYIN